MKYGKGRFQEWVAKSESTLSAVGNKMLERVTVCKVTIGSVGVHISKSVCCCANSMWLGFAASIADAVLQRIQRHDPYLISPHELKCMNLTYSVRCHRAHQVNEVT
jgi:hypothetical protein